MTPAPALTNVLYCDDNLPRLGELPDESIDLIYLDPPFFSNSTYEVVFGDEAEIRTFEDRWAGGILHYIDWMRPRVEEMHRVLKQSGSFYLHCDWHAHHHLRLLVDEVFGANCFRNSIVWSYRRWPDRRFGQYQRMHDDILFYTKEPGRKHTFHVEYEPASASFMKRFGGKRQVLDPERPTRKLVTEEQTKGLPRRDVWEISIIAPAKKERLGYPTQKPEPLLEVIVRTSSNEGDIVLDPFCGCGTTVAVAEKLRRPWIGIDISPTAITVCEGRLRDLGADFTVCGMPQTVASLMQLKPFEFQNWVINQIRGTRSPRKTADMGIDGYTAEGDPVQVKRSPRVGRNVVDNFQTAIVRAKKNRGFVVAGGFTRNAYEEAARARAEHGIEMTLVRVGDLLEHDRMVGAGIVPPRLFVAEPFIPRGVREARPTAEQLVLSAAEEGKEEPPVLPPPTPRRTDVVPAVAPGADAPDLAEELLRRAGIERPPVRLERILDDLNVEVRSDPTVTGDARLYSMSPPGQQPVTAWELRLNPSRPPARQRFTIAHEIGHALLHGAPHHAAAARGAGGRNVREREADRFAAALLMPERYVRAAVRQYGANVDRLRSLFLVSRQAMENRLRDLGLGG